MKRRTYLDSIGGLAVAGYLGLNYADLEPPRLVVSVSNIKTNPDIKNLEFDVTVIDWGVTDSSTARVRLEFKNNSNEELTLNLDENPKHRFSGGQQPGLILLPDGHDVQRKSNKYWKPDKSEFITSLYLPVTHLDPKESLTQEYEVWSHPRQREDCLNAGNYEFSEKYGNFILIFSNPD